MTFVQVREGHIGRDPPEGVGQQHEPLLPFGFRGQEIDCLGNAPRDMNVGAELPPGIVGFHLVLGVVEDAKAEQSHGNRGNQHHGSASKQARGGHREMRPSPPTLLDANSNRQHPGPRMRVGKPGLKRRSHQELNGNRDDRNADRRSEPRSSASRRDREKNRASTAPRETGSSALNRR